MKIGLAETDDYTGLYIDGKLKSWNDTYNYGMRDLENHLNLPVTIDSIEVRELDWDALEENGLEPHENWEDNKFIN